jgi:hypothetical protein
MMMKEARTRRMRQHWTKEKRKRGKPFLSFFFRENIISIPPSAFVMERLCCSPMRERREEGRGEEKRREETQESGRRGKKTSSPW